jgi:hypothetical protein
MGSRALCAQIARLQLQRAAFVTLAEQALAHSRDSRLAPQDRMWWWNIRRRWQATVLNLAGKLIELGAEVSL